MGRYRATSTRQRGVSFLVFATLASLYVLFLRPVDGLDRYRTVARAPEARLALNARGRSGAVAMRFALPGEQVDLPLEVHGDPAALRYSWLPVGKVSTTDAPSLASTLLAPKQPGFYRLAVLSDSGMRVFDDVPLAVLVPFSAKTGTELNGYRIGKYRVERRPFESVAAPRGFIQVMPGDLDLQVTEHLRLADFISHDAQSTWPRYVALDPRLLDKLELVFRALTLLTDSVRDGNLSTIDVRSGFRTPLHNRQVARSASDSRHQYGDAADVTVDADRNGRVNAADARLVASAVERVEREHPDLVGGLGLYTRSGTAYVHIDARGTRARWRG